MSDDLKRNLAVGVVRGLHAQNLITEEQMNLAVKKLVFSIYKNSTPKQPQGGIVGDEGSLILQSFDR